MLTPNHSLKWLAIHDIWLKELNYRKIYIDLKVRMPRIIPDFAMPACLSEHIVANGVNGKRLSGI